MKFFSNKILVLFLIFTVILFSYSSQIAKAGGVGDVINDIIEPVLDVIYEVIFVAVPVASNIVINLLLGYIEISLGWVPDTLGYENTWTESGKCRLDNAEKSPLYAANMCGEDYGTWQGVAGAPVLNSQSAVAIVTGGNCITGFLLSYKVTDAYQYAIYRDGNLITQATLSATVQPSPFISEFSYSDNNLAPSTTYEYLLLLVNKDGQQFQYPALVSYTICPRVDLKINNSDGPLNFYLPDNNAVLNWLSYDVNSCSALNDWIGIKDLNGSENLGQLSRGTANPGSGKNYQFSITCDAANIGSVTDSVNATVFEYPVCSFGANPSTITLPNSSQLSQTCSYADSCSIDQGIGTVCSGESDCATDGVSVRPTATTTFTLTCQGLDGSRTWQTTVGIGQPGDIKYEEVPPR